jgi:hypothetical protein
VLKTREKLQIKCDKVFKQGQFCQLKLQRPYLHSSVNKGIKIATSLEYLEDELVLEFLALDTSFSNTSNFMPYHSSTFVSQ